MRAGRTWLDRNWVVEGLARHGLAARGGWAAGLITPGCAWVTPRCMGWCAWLARDGFSWLRGDASNKRLAGGGPIGEGKGGRKEGRVRERREEREKNLMACSGFLKLKFIVFLIFWIEISFLRDLSFMISIFN